MARSRLIALALVSAVLSTLLPTAQTPPATVFGHGLLAVERAGAAHWFLPDALGTTRRVTDGAGAIEASYQYEAFGRTSSTSGTLANDVRFTGERSDEEAGLIFLRARHYDPSVGRFVQADRWPYDARVSGDLNRYAYVRNDPANAVDPSGHFIDTVFDVVSVAVSVWTYIQEPSDENRNWLAADLAATFIPGVPAFAGWAGRAARATAGAVRRGYTTAARVAAAARAPAVVSRARPWVDAGQSVASRLRRVNRPQVATPQAVKAAPGRRPDVGPGGPRPPTGGISNRGNLAGSIRNVNPLQGTNNCVNCVIATHATLNGRSASALLSGPKPISVLEQEFGAKFTRVADRAEIEQLLQQAGTGAEGVVFGSRGAQGVGHVFNAINQKGTIRFLDGQSGGMASFHGFQELSFMMIPR